MTRLALDEGHLNAFAEYSRLFKEAGGPDPHVFIVAEQARHLEDERSAWWLAGCYVAAYTVAGAAALFTATGGQPQADEAWWLRFCEEHQKGGVPMRRERRAVYARRKMAACLASYATWVDRHLGHLRHEPYERLWRAAADVKYFGRYAQIKLLGVMEIAGLLEHAVPDIRPPGAWSPRDALALIAPDATALLCDDLSARPAVVAQVNEVASIVKAAAEKVMGMEMSWLDFETFLCNYRQGIGTKGKYVASSHDTELAYWVQGEAYWAAHGVDISRGVDFFGVRARLFDERALGEASGWWGPREELYGAYHHYGYWWTDLLYNYRATLHPSAPVPWRAA